MMTSEQQYTRQAIYKASQAETLAEQGSCEYVNDEMHCIVGQVLADHGLPDAMHEGMCFTPLDNLKNRNEARIVCRTDLFAFIEKVGLDLDTLDKAQREFDNQEFQPEYYL